MHMMGNSGAAGGEREVRLAQVFEEIADLPRHLRKPTHIGQVRTSICPPAGQVF